MLSLHWLLSRGKMLSLVSYPLHLNANFVEASISAVSLLPQAHLHIYLQGKTPLPTSFQSTDQAAAGDHIYLKVCGSHLSKDLQQDWRLQLLHFKKTCWKLNASRKSSKVQPAEQEGTLS